LLIVGEVTRFADHRSLYEQFPQFAAGEVRASQTGLLRTAERGTQERA